jgi:hypothetical protein
MVQDAMNAIQIAEQQDFVKTFDSIKGFSHSIDTRLQSYMNTCTMVDILGLLSELLCENANIT